MVSIDKARELTDEEIYRRAKIPKSSPASLRELLGIQAQLMQAQQLERIAESLGSIDHTLAVISANGLIVYSNK